jgi:ADP-ribosylglycohydrolase
MIMQGIDTQDRALGAIVGCFIGDALGVGPHWYYNLEKMREDYGSWISGYTAPRKGRWHEGLQPGDNSQTGQVTLMLLESLACTHGVYDQDDFTSRMNDLLATLDGTMHGGRMTDIAMRELWKVWNRDGSWDHAGSHADTAEAAIRATVMAAAYAHEPEQLAEVALKNIRLTHNEPFIAAQSLAFCLVVCALIRDMPLGRTRLVVPQWAESTGLTRFFHDTFIQPDLVAQAASNPHIHIDPPLHVCQLFGLPCQLGFLAPAAYYLTARFPDEFEMPVLSAINGGGNNMARAALTGALSGALVGFSNIPKRLVDGLQDGMAILPLARKVTEKLGSS